MGKKLYTDNPICNLTHVSPSKIHDYLTLLTSTEKQLTQATFKLAPSGTPGSCYASWAIESLGTVCCTHLIHWSDSPPLRSGLFWIWLHVERVCQHSTERRGFSPSSPVNSLRRKVNLTGCCVHSYGRFLFLDMFLCRITCAKNWLLLI